MMLFRHLMFLKWWISSVISTYLLYLEWNLGMLVVDMCILWPPTVHNLAISPMLLKPTAQKENMDWNFSTRSSSLCAAPVAILWCYGVFHWSIQFQESHFSLLKHYLCNKYTLFMTFGYLWILLIPMYGTIGPGEYIRWILSFGIKNEYDKHSSRLITTTPRTWLACNIPLHDLGMF
jgi:hypothetical protein